MMFYEWEKEWRKYCVSRESSFGTETQKRDALTYDDDAYADDLYKLLLLSFASF